MDAISERDRRTFMKMQSINNGNLLEIIDLAHSLWQEHLFIANEQAAFNRLNETLSRNSSSAAVSVAQVSNSILLHSISISILLSRFPERKIVKLKVKKCQLMRGACFLIENSLYFAVVVDVI